MTHFKLSAAGKLTVALAIALTVTTPASAAGIIAGGANQPQVSTNAQGTDIVNIVAPSASGLSHNQYQNYSVDGSGAVLNNALQAGQSQLAGQLQANSNLHGQAAKIILNEVVTRNPSLLLGQQEVFGMAADFVLANPNGITCNGCGFINTPRSSLVVGSPNVSEGNLHGYTTLNNRNALQIGQGGVHGADVLDLIAPKIDARGPITAGQAIHAISGLNEVSRDAKITYSAPVGGNGLDSYYLGGMQAGRIRLVSTAAGSGVNISGALKAAQGIDADSRGDMTLTAANLHGGDINLTAQNLTLRSEVQHHEQSSQGADNYQNYRGGINRGSHQQEESLTRSSLHGNDIKLVSRDNQHLSATDVDGQQVTLQGRNVTLDSQVTRNSQEKHDNQWFYSWEHNESSSSLNETQHGTQIHAAKQAQVIADQDVTLTGSRIESGNDLSVKAGGKLTLQGAQEQHRSQHTLYVKNETAALRSDQGSVSLSGSQSQQNAQGGNLELALNANRKQTPASDNAVADHSVTQAAPSTASTVSKVVKAGSGSVKLDGNLHRETRQHNSSVQAANVTIDSAQDTRLQNSSVKGEQVAITSGGNLQLDSREDSVLDLSAKLNAGATHTDAKDDKGNSATLGQSILKNGTLDSEGHALRSHEVIQSSQIDARDDVTLQTGGETRLHAAQIHSEQGQVKQTGSTAVLTDNQGHKDEASWKADIANSLRRLFGGKDSESKEKLPVSGQYQPTDSVTHSSITEGKAQS